MNFDWNSLKENLQKDALTEGNKKYEVDDRFYKLSRDKNDNGGALIRFVVDKNSKPFVKMTKITARHPKETGNKRFVSEWSPLTIGKPDPFNEKFIKLWTEEGRKEEAKKYSRAFRYITNIVVIKDPANPENEGKTFLLDMSPTLFQKLKEAIEPTEAEIALGAESKAVFDPINGYSFLLKVSKANTGFLSYETSKFKEETSAIYKNVAEAEKEIKKNTYDLSEFLKPENFLSYEELQQKLAWFDGGDAKETAEETAKETVKETPKQEDELDVETVETDSTDSDKELEDLLSDFE